MRFATAAAFAMSVVAGCSSKPAESAATGPKLQGTFEATLGPNTDMNGEPAGDVTTDKWVFRSVCKDRHCVATAVAIAGAAIEATNPSSRVFDFIDGKWIWVGVIDSTCMLSKTNETVAIKSWKQWVLEPKPDGTLAGTADTWAQAERCNSAVTGPVKLTRAGDDANVEVPDPSTQPAFVASPAAALHGHYKKTTIDAVTGAPGKTDTVRITTECLRAGDSCASVIVYDKNPAKPEERVGFSVYVFAGGAWGRIYVVPDQHCSPTGTATLTRTETFRLPDPPTNPIARFEENGEYVYTGDCPATNRIKYIYERIGD